MTRKSAPKKAQPAKPKKPKKVTAYIAVRELESDLNCYTAPTRIFATKKAALAHAEALNRELRATANPFERYSPDDELKGGEKVLLTLLKKLGAPVPKQPKGEYSYIDWEKWWDAAYFDLTDAQRDAVWDALEDFIWYAVKTVTVE